MKIKHWICAVPALLLPALAWGGTNEDGIPAAPFYSTTVQGGFTAAGIGTVLYQQDHGTATFGLNLSTVPAGASIIKAYAVWTYLSDSPNQPTETTFTLNGNTVTASSHAQADLTALIRNHVVSYLAEVTPYVTGNGSYSIADAVEDANTFGISEGFSLVVAYSLATDPLRAIHFYHGLTQTMGTLPAAATLTLPELYQGGAAHFLVNASDSNAGLSEDFFINGSHVASDLWAEALGRGYDHFDADVSGYMASGSGSLDFATTGYGNPIYGGNGDYVYHSLAAISYEVPEPATAGVLGLGVIGLLKRRQRG